MNLLLVALLALQDPAVAEPLKRIDGKDPAACFRAIAELAGLDAKHRPDIEKAAAALPEFYRDALLAELRATGVPPAVTLKGTGKGAAEWLKDLSRQTGLAIEDRGGHKTEPFDLDLDGVPAMEALTQILTQGRTSLWWNNQRKVFDVRNDMPVMRSSHGTRNGSLVLTSKHRGRRTLAGRPPVSYASLTMMGVTPPGEGIVAWSVPRVYEAVGENGAALELFNSWESGLAASPQDPWLAEYRRWNSYPWFTLRIGPDQKKIDRLKFSIRVRVATSVRTLELSGPAAAGKESVKQDGYEFDVRDLESLGPRFGRFRFRVRSDKPELAAMLGMLPVSMALEGEKPNDIGSHWAGDLRSIPGGVEYDWTWLGGGGPDRTSVEPGWPKKIRFTIPATLEERTIFVEFRDIPLR